MSEPVIPERMNLSDHFAENFPVVYEHIRKLEAKVAEQAEYMRLAAIECKSLMGFRDEALRLNEAQAATIAELKEVVHKYQYESMLWRDKEREQAATIRLLSAMMEAVVAVLQNGNMDTFASLVQRALGSALKK